MDVISADLLEIERIDVGRHFHIAPHTGRRYEVANIVGNFEQAATIFDAKLFHGRCDSQTNGGLSALVVGHHQVARHGIQSAVNTFNTGVKRFEIDTYKPLGLRVLAM